MTEIISPELFASQYPIAFFGYARAKPGHHRELLELMLSLGGPSRSEPGIITYEVHHNASEPDSVAFYELYANGAAVQSHLEQEHMQKFFADSVELLASDLEISLLEPLRAVPPDLV